MTVTDTLQRDGDLAAKTAALFSIEDRINAHLDKGETVPGDLDASYGKARDEVQAAMEAAQAAQDSAEADKLEDDLKDKFDNEQAHELKEKSQTRALMALEEIYDKVDKNIPFRMEFLASQCALDDVKGGKHRGRQELFKPTPDHYIFQEQAKVSEETFEQLPPSLIAADYSKYGGKKKDRDEMKLQAILPRSAMELTAATGDTITTQSGDFPDLTTFAGQIEQSRDAFAPMTRAEYFNVWMTPGNVSKREISQIQDDGIPTWDTTEGQAPTDSNAEFDLITLYCKQLLQNSSFSRWADWDDFLNSLPNAIRTSVANGMFRELNVGLTTGSGANPGTATGVPKGVLRALDDQITNFSVPAGDAYIAKAKGATNPFNFRDIGNLIDLMDDGIAQGGKVFLMAHKRFFGNIRDNLYSTNPGVINGMWPLANLSDQNRAALLYGSMWMEKALNNSAMSLDYNAGATNHCVFINGEAVIVRYLPLMIDFNTYRISDSRRVAVEATSGGWCEVTWSAAENTPAGVAARTNP